MIFRKFPTLWDSDDLRMAQLTIGCSLCSAAQGRQQVQEARSRSLPKGSGRRQEG